MTVIASPASNVGTASARGMDCRGLGASTKTAVVTASSAPPSVEGESAGVRVGRKAMRGRG